MEENEVTSEAAVNEAAAAEVAANTAPAEEQVAENTVAAPASEQKTAPQKTAPVDQAAFDAQKSYEEIKQQLAETRKWATQQSQIRAQHEKDLASMKKEMEKRLAEMSEEPFNLEQFNKDFIKNGFKAFDPYLEKKLSSVRETYEPELQQVKQQLEEERTNRVIDRARGDTKKYPNFNELEPKMVEMLMSPTCPIDKSLPLDQKLDAVYQMVRTQHSTEAIKAATKVGYDKAQADLAKEAKTAVATGGKGLSATPADFKTMPLDKLEQYINQTHGTVDR